MSLSDEDYARKAAMAASRIAEDIKRQLLTDPEGFALREEIRRGKILDWLIELERGQVETRAIYRNERYIG